MADTDITLTVGLDPKSINQQVSDLRKEVERQMSDAMKSINKVGEKASSEADVTPQVDTKALDAANAKIQELTNRLNELYSQQNNGAQALENANMQIQDLQNTLGELSAGQWQQTLEYMNSLMYAPEAQPAVDHIVELMEEANALSGQLEQNADLDGAQERLQSIGSEIATIIHTLIQSGQAWERPNEEVQRLTARIAQLENQIRQLGQSEGEAGENVMGLLAGFSGGGTAGATLAGASVIINKIFRTLKKMAVTVIGITLGVRGIQSVINKLRSAIKEGFKAIYEGDKKFKEQVDDLKKSWAEVKANLAAAFLPLVEIAIPYIQRLIDWINLLISKLAMFVALISGQNAYTKAIKATGDAANRASKQLSKFDELNNLTTNGNGWQTQEVAVDPKMAELLERVKAILSQIKVIFDELVTHPFMEGFTQAIGDWPTKLDTIKKNLQNIGTNMTQIFSSKELEGAVENYIKSISKFFGAMSGLFANIGLNIGMAITGGIEQFLNEHKLEIQEDLTEMFTIASDIFDNFSQLAIDISTIIDTIGESSSLQDTISNLLTVVYKLYSALELVLLKVVELTSGTVAEAVRTNIEKIKTGLERVFEILASVSGFLEAVATTIKNVLQRLMDEVITPLFEFLKPIISDLIGIVLDLWSKLSPIFNYVFNELTKLWKEYIDPILHSIIDLIREVMTPILDLLGVLWDNYLKPIVKFLVDALGMLTPIIKIAFDGTMVLIKTLLIILDQMIKTITDAVKVTVAILKGDWKGAWEAAKQYFEDLFIAPIGRMIMMLWDHAKSFWNNLKELLANMGLALARLVESISNILISFINDVVINAVNGLIKGANLIPGVDFTELTPINTKNYHLPTIPALAQGAVIPPSMSDFIARLGDNNKETEVVSPLSTMKQAVLEALQEGGVGGDIHVTVEVDGKVLASTIVKQDRINRKSTGKGLFAY